ncbi:hypothetical protein B0A55_03536 [Friedmanniomyces simplex]|uniref:Uncharacterized protein n=1 Tax=Friedmanniomyces simplex TaxID=329884 RepID=A0A4U0XF32_9PEZI|nr:hypothetical protein B0A55_03536 [Friedmanniomyces simplex]
MAPWLRFVEAFLVEQLLRTPAFHRAVEKVAKSVHRVRHGIPPEELGGTRIDTPNSQNNGFLGHFLDEVKQQLGNESKSKSLSGGSGVNVDSRAMGHAGGVKSKVEVQAAKVDEHSAEGAESAWKEAQKSAAVPPRQGFLGEYAQALRQQVKSERKT